MPNQEGLPTPFTVERIKKLAAESKLEGEELATWQELDQLCEMPGFLKLATAFALTIEEEVGGVDMSLVLKFAWDGRGTKTYAVLTDPTLTLSEICAGLVLADSGTGMALATAYRMEKKAQAT